MNSDELPPPLPPPARIRELDVIRGVAILGILLLNIKGFAMNDGAYFYPSLYDHFDTASDKLAWFLSELFFGGKFYPMLAIVFGAGIVLMAGVVEGKRRRPGPTHYRRMAGLFVIGLLHAYLLWHGDVLTQYALCGALAYPFHRRRPRTLLVLSMICLLVVLCSWLSFPSTNSLFDLDAYREGGRDEVAVYQGPWIEQFEMRAWTARQYQTSGYIISFQPLGMMFLGMFLLKTGNLGTSGNPRRLRTVAAAACATGWMITATGMIYWWHSGFALMGSYYIMTAWLLIGGIITSLGYLAAIRRWIDRDPLPHTRSILEAIGRTALSNYLLQSLIASFIFHGQGLGLIGSLGRVAQLLTVPVIWSAQIVLTLAWLKHHPQGPVEMLLRKITKRSSKPAKRIEAS